MSQKINSGAGTMPATIECNSFQYIPIDKLRPFQNHAFKLYEGEKLDRMTQSIMENGVMQPIIVRPIEGTDEFEIISGHNRRKATERAGLTEIPAVIRNLDDDEAAILANETNIIQRSLKDWQPSEIAKSVYQYYTAVKSQGKRPDKETGTSGGNNQKSPEGARAKTAAAYDVTESMVRVYVEIYDLIDGLKDRLDSEHDPLGITAAQSLSYIPSAGQTLLNSVLTEYEDIGKISVAKAVKLREALKDYAGADTSDEDKTKDRIKKILSKKTSSSQPKPTPDKAISIPLDAKRYEELFSDRPIEAVVEEIIAAIKAYRNKKNRKGNDTAVVSKTTKPKQSTMSEDCPS